MLLQDLPVDARLIVKPFHVADRRQFRKVAVAFGIFGQQHHVIGRFGCICDLFLSPVPRGDVDFAADDGLNAGFFDGLVKIDGPM